MHLNVPKKHISTLSSFILYCRWSLLGVFGPELIIWTAWRQFLSAKALCNEIESLIIEVSTSFHSRTFLALKTIQVKPDTRSTYESWTLVHGFYAAMGGFVVDLDSAFLQSQPRFVEGVTRLTVTPKGVRLLAKCGHLPYIRKDDIADRSKTDELGKFLACLQASWMLVEVCTRLVLGVSITLLEVTTLGHVLCALVLYLLWWHKPRWIREPTRLEGDWVAPLCAFMYMASTVSGSTEGASGLHQRFAGGRSEISTLGYFVINQEQDKSRKDPESEAPSNSPPLPGNKTEIEDLQDGFFANRPLVGSSSTPLHGAEDSDTRTRSESEEVDGITRARRHLASQAVTQYPAVRTLMQNPTPDDVRKYHTASKVYPEMPKRFMRHVESSLPLSRSWLECETEHLVCLNASNWPSDELLRTTGGLAMGTILWTTSIAFSAVHVAAWYASFPSVIEAWLWRSASVYIGFSGLLWSAMHITAQYSGRIWWLWYNVLIGEAPGRITAIVTLMCVACGAAYVFSRAYLIVGSFVSLRSLPEDAFLIPQWTLSVPHL